MKETAENTDYPDAITIKDSVERGQIKIHSPGEAKVKALTWHPEMHLGEAPARHHLREDGKPAQGLHQQDGSNDREQV